MQTDTKRQERDMDMMRITRKPPAVGVTAKGFRYYFRKNGAAYQADQDMVVSMVF